MILLVNYALPAQIDWHAGYDNGMSGNEFFGTMLLGQEGELPFYTSVHYGVLVENEENWRLLGRAVNADNGQASHLVEYEYPEGDVIVHAGIKDESLLIAGSLVIKEGISKEREGLLMSFNEGGELDWLRTYGALDTVDRIHNLIEFPGGGHLLCGWTFKSYSTNHPIRGWLLRVDKKGELIWERTFSGGFAYDFMPEAIVCEPPSGHIYVMSRISAPYRMALSKFDGHGQELWTRYYNFGNFTQPLQMERSTDGQLVVSMAVNYPEYGNRTVPTLVKLDTAGNMVWQEDYYEELGYGGFASPFTRLHSGGYATCVMINYDFPALIVTDSEGQAEHTFLMEEYDYYLYPRSIKQLEDGALVIAGDIPISSSEEVDNTIWLMKTLPFGPSPVSVTELHAPPHRLHVYPNPAANWAVFDAGQRWPPGQTAVLSIFGIQGREVQRVPFSGQYRWDAGGMPAGLYSYQLRGAGGVLLGSGKVVVGVSPKN